MRTGTGSEAAVAVASGPGPEPELEVLLVDYDDCLVVDTPVHSAAEFRAALMASGAAAAGPGCFAALFVGGAFPDVEAALERAFRNLH